MQDSVNTRVFASDVLFNVMRNCGLHISLLVLQNLITFVELPPLVKFAAMVCRPTFRPIFH